MPARVQTSTENTTLDVLKGFCCILIASSHLPSFWSSPVVDAYYLSWYIRFCVPLFFVSSGYFFHESRQKGRFLRRIFLLYCLSYLLYLPRILQGAATVGEALSLLRWNLVIGYEHLWYLNAALMGFAGWYVLQRLPIPGRWLYRVLTPVCVALLLAGGLLDEYYPLVQQPLVAAAGSFLARFGGPRNVIFMGFPLLFLGGALAHWRGSLQKVPTAALVLAYLALRALAFWECRWLLAHR